MMTKKVKYPKKLGTTEITLRNKHLCRDIQAEECLWDDFGLNATGGQLSEKQIKTLSRSAFELAGAFPYVFDVINWVCTHNPHKISRKNSPDETHYKVKIPWEIFFEAAFDKYNLSGSTQRLHDDLHKLTREPLVRVVPLNESKSLLTPLIISKIEYDEKSSIPLQYHNLKNITGKPIDSVILEFYKPIWASLIEGEYAKAWFLTPKAFTARIYYAIKQYAELQEFKRFGNFGTSLNYRRLFVYMNMHDNGTRRKAHYNAVDLARSCLPGELKPSGGALRSWPKVRRFFQKGMLLLNKMATDGIMESLGVIPSSVWYDQRRGTLSIDICRDYAQLSDLIVKK